MGEKEIKSITDLLKDFQIKHEVLSHETATKTKFLQLLSENEYSIVHFGGLINFDPLNKSKDLVRIGKWIEKPEIGILFPALVPLINIICLYFQSKFVLNENEQSP